MGKIIVRVPATSANMGPGFDTLGCAFELYNIFSFEETGNRLNITGCEKKYAGEDNLAAVAYYAALEKIGLKKPAGLKIHIQSDVPVSRGLGSSSTLIVAGVTAANAIHGSKMSKEEILALCSQMEGHPDNVAPAIYGGLVASVLRDGAPVIVRYDINPSIRFTALIPDFPTSTEEARAALPDDIKRLDAVYTVGCLAVLLKALETGDEKALAASLDDRLHQPYRKKMIDEYDKVREAALSSGCAGFVISGSGSTCLCVGGNSSFPEMMKEIVSSYNNKWEVLPLKVDMEGAAIVQEAR